MSKQLSTERLKLITKPSQEVIRVTKLKSSLLMLAWLTSGRRQLRTKSVDLTPNNRELIEEIINGSITLVKKLLLTNSSKKSRLSGGLIATTKKSPYLMSPLKLHNLSKKLVLHTSHKNRTSPSILIKPSLIITILRLIRRHPIIIIYNKHLLLSSHSLLHNHRLSMSQMRRRTGKLTREKIPQSKTTYVQTRARDPVAIVGVIEKHRSSQYWDEVRRSQKRFHDDDESAREKAERAVLFYPTLTVP
jgi:hypothetical protein